MMGKVVLVALLVQFCVAKTVVNFKGNDTNIRRKSTGFLLSMPKSLVSGTNATVCLSLHEPTFPAKILIDLKWKGKHYPTLKTIQSDSICFKLNVPLRKMPEAQFVSVRVQVQINGHVYNAHNQDPILVYPPQQNRVFVETDRGIYKPGDLVKFLSLQLNRNFLPVARKIADVRIKNPMGITVMAWQNLTTDHGLLRMDYQMLPESMIGKWKLQVENYTRYFEVAKYSIPRFKIDLRYPKTVYFQAKSITITVCGKYSYNKPVAGIAFIKLSNSLENIEAVHRLIEMVNGCSHFEINHTDLGLEEIGAEEMYIHITATITEYGTNKMDVASGKSRLVFKGYKLQFTSSPIFVPGVAYQGHLKLTSILTSVHEEVVEICYNMAIKKSWNFFNNEQCQNYTVSDEGTVSFRLWPLKDTVLHVHLHARSINNSLISAESLTLVRLFSPSSSHIQLNKDGLNMKACGSSYRYAVTFATDSFDSEEKVTFFYTVKTATEILQMGRHMHKVQKSSLDSADATLYLGELHKYVKLGTSLDKFAINFTINKMFVSRYMLLVYYVTKSGETVAATKSEDVVPCSLQVSSHWSQEQVLPGSTATLTISSATPALCAVSATDRSVKLMAANSNRNITLERLLKVFALDREGAKSGRNTCLLNGKKAQSKNPENLRRQKRQHVHWFSEDYDASDVFSAFGSITITNFQMVTKPCYTEQMFNESRLALFLTDHYDTAHEDGSQGIIRSFFPENWLWELVPVGLSASHLQRTVPHSITNWVTNVFCISENRGLGFAQEIELTSFQAFFVELLTPHSIKNGENFNLLVHVSNYVNYSFPIKVSIRLSENLVLTHQSSATYCLKSNSTQTHNYPIAAVQTGTANLTVLVESESQYPFPCGPETIVSKRDVVFKSLQVEPEGYYMANTKSALLCASKPHFQNNVTWSVNIPKGIVAGTEKVMVSLNADMLGQSIQNLHQLLTIPAGCGEQIMASMAPNLYVLRYLNETGGLTASLKQRILRNLKLGYQRILNYGHSDGSFSAFGYYDPAGSMFLTTFVVKVLQQAKSLIYVDARVLDRAVLWIFRHQLENGCFDTMHHVFQDMGGTNMENSTAGLTAYVISSLFEAKVDVPDTVQVNAKYCIRSQNNPDQYSMVISSYALFKVHWISEATRFLEKAIGVAHKANSYIWWSTRETDDSNASDIEITSYALLALLEQKTAENMAYAHSIVQWLMSKMGPSGGFKSTQDTIVALDALTRYSQQTRTGALELDIEIDAFEAKKIFAIREQDRLKSKQLILPNQEGKVALSMTGTGCALGQLTVSYFSTNISESEAFKLNVEVASISNVDQCSIKSISPCLSYQGPGQQSNMAVMEFALPSGFKADRSSLYELVETGKEKNIKMFEEKDSQINIYFTSLGKSSVCFTFKINENLPIENRKESIVKLYDYYRPEQSLLQFYQVVNNCSRSALKGLEETGINMPENHTRIHKRNVHCSKHKRSGSLNKDFVNEDVDLETPNCLNVPFYLPMVDEGGKNGTGSARHSTRRPHPVHPVG